MLPVEFNRTPEILRVVLVGGESIRWLEPDQFTPAVTAPLI